MFVVDLLTEHFRSRCFACDRQGLGGTFFFHTCLFFLVEGDDCRSASSSEIIVSRRNQILSATHCHDALLLTVSMHTEARIAHCVTIKSVMVFPCMCDRQSMSESSMLHVVQRLVLVCVCSNNLMASHKKTRRTIDSTLLRLQKASLRSCVGHQSKVRCDLQVTSAGSSTDRQKVRLQTDSSLDHLV